MDKDFDNLIRELVNSKKYTYNKSLLVKAKLGVKAAYTKALVVKGAIAASTIGTMTLGGVAYYQSVQQNNTAQATHTEHVILNENGISEEELIAEWPKKTEENVAIEKEMPGQFGKKETTSVRVMDDADTQQNGSRKVVQQIPKDPLVVKTAYTKNSQPTTHTKPRDKGSPAKRVFIAIPEMSIVLKDDLNWSSKKSLSTPTASPPDLIGEPRWSIAFTLGNGNTNITDNLSTGEQRVIHNNTQRIALDVKRKIAGQWHIGTGIQQLSFEEEREYQTKQMVSINERIGQGSLDSIVIRDGRIFNPFTGRWEVVDTPFVQYWLVPGDIIRDTIWENRTERITNRFKTIQIPITLSYGFETGRWTFMPTIGVNIGRIYSLNYSTNSAPNEGLQSFAIKELQSNLLNLSAQAEIQYRLALRNYVIVGINHGRSLRSFGGNGDLTLQTSSTRYTAGLGFTF